jgi:transcriptional regulator with XRE-family HTH domain
MEKSVYLPRFRACREAAGLTQREAATTLGRTPSAIQKWESGMNSPTMDDIYGLAEAYRIDPATFFHKGDDEVDVKVVTGDNTIIALQCKRIDDLATAGRRKRVIGQVSECAEALAIVPEEFAVAWIAGLKACVLLVEHDKHRPGKWTRGESSKSIEPAIRGANDGSAPPMVRRHNKSRAPIVPVGRIP